MPDDAFLSSSDRWELLDDNSRSLIIQNLFTSFFQEMIIEIYSSDQYFLTELIENVT